MLCYGYATRHLILVTEQHYQLPHFYVINILYIYILYILSLIVYLKITMSSRAPLRLQIASNDQCNITNVFLAVFKQLLNWHLA